MEETPSLQKATRTGTRVLLKYHYSIKYTVRLHPIPMTYDLQQVVVLRFCVTGLHTIAHNVGAAGSLVVRALDL